MNVETIKKRAEVLKLAEEQNNNQNSTYYWAANTILELCDEVVRLKNECSGMGKLLQSGIVISYEEHTKYENITAANKVMLLFVRKSHHIDGCSHRYGKDCDCGKFKIEAEECMK